MPNVLPQADHEVGADRGDRVLARVRRRQLELALVGRYEESARYARRARRVRRYIGECAPCLGYAQ